VSPNLANGYTLAYEGDEIQFPVYVIVAIGVAFSIAATKTGNAILFALALCAFGFAFYNYPLLETGRPRVGAGQYGIFAEGLGVVAWRAIKLIEIVPVAMRGAMSNELHIILQEPFERALLADWRKRPAHRFLMRLPWSMAAKDVIRIPLDVFDRPASEIHHNFIRMMRFYRN
jgi:hypothetical protein